MKDTSTLIKALEILARDVESNDGVANTVIADAATTISELVAQNVMLRSALMDQLNDFINFDGGKLTDSIMLNSSNTINATPQQCLREIQAEAGRDGFIRGIKLRQLGPCNDWDLAADEYAVNIRKGEVK